MYNSTIAGKIQSMIAQRSEILSFKPNDPEVNGLAERIHSLLEEAQESLPVEFILESLTRLGAAPSLLYDDDGHWTIGTDGTQPVMAFADRTKETTFDAVWWVQPNSWRKTIREAIRDYLADDGDV